MRKVAKPLVEKYRGEIDGDLVKSLQVGLDKMRGKN
jgi:hypothetical protein